MTRGTTMKKQIIKIFFAVAMLAVVSLEATSCIFVMADSARISSAKCNTERKIVRVYFDGTCSDPDCDILVWDGDKFLSSCRATSYSYTDGNDYVDFSMAYPIPYGAKVVVSPSEYSTGLSGSYQFYAY